VDFVMGRSSELVRNGGDGNQQPEQIEAKHNPFAGLIDGAKDLFGKAKTEVQKIDKKDVGDAVGKVGRVIGEGADKIGANGIGQQAREISGSGERVIKGQGSQADRERLLNAGVEAGKLAVGGGSLNVAEQVLKRSGGGSLGDVVGGLGGLFGKGARELTRLDTLGFVKSVRENWDVLDSDKDGYISSENIKAASQDKFFALKNAHMLSVLEEMYEPLSNCQNDEFGSEDNGISRADIRALEKGKLEGTGMGFTAAGAGALDAKYIAAIAGGSTAYLNHAGGASKMLSRGGLAAGGVLAVGGIYGAIDYYGSRKENIEKIIGELK
jgi:hypothetical protein